MADINDFTREVECIYKDERYAVRDNGAVFRYPRDGKRPRKYDNFWTFGKPNIVHGYMEIASVRVHAIVATLQSAYCSQTASSFSSEQAVSESSSFIRS